MELADILSSIRRRWRIVAGMILLTGAVLAAFYVTREEVEPIPRYRAANNILVPARDDKGELPDDTPAPLLYGQAAIATSAEVRRQALETAGVPADRQGAVAFSYGTSEEGNLIMLTVTAGDAATASAVVTGWSDAYLEARRESVANGQRSAREQATRALRVLDTRRKEIEAQITNIDPALLELNPGTATDEDGESVGTSNVPYDLPIDVALLVYDRQATLASINSQRQAAALAGTGNLLPDSYGDVVEVPPVANVTKPVSSPQTPTLLIVAIGLVLALALPVLIDRMDHTIRDAKTAAAAFSAPVLSSIPAASRTRRHEIARPGTAREGAFRALAATAVATDRLPRSIVVTSPLGDEQDAVAANFAAALASLGVRVALVGTSPRQAWFAENVVNENGHSSTTTFPQLLALAYSGRLNGEAPKHLRRTNVENMFVLPPGQADIDVSTDGLAPMLQALAASNIDVTVIAAPALLQDPNTTIYAWTTRSVLWVMETGEIKVEEAREAASRLLLAGVTPFGVAMVAQES